MQTIRIATRRSRLALAQADFVAEQLRRRNPGLATELVGLATAGDRQQQADAPPAGKQDFVDALLEALASGRADAAAHSMKDVPAQPTAAFPVCTFGPRADARDALVLSGARAPSEGGLHSLPAGARVGTSSQRRRAFLQGHDRTLAVVPVRGNVETRLSRLDAGEFDALLLACAGLERLDLGARIGQRIEPAAFVPAPGQGAIALQWAAAREDVAALAAGHIDAHVQQAVVAERDLAVRLGADCATPLGVHCHRGGDGAWHLLVQAASTDGSQCMRLMLVGDDPSALAAQAAAQLATLGIGDLLAAAEAQRPPQAQLRMAPAPMRPPPR